MVTIMLRKLKLLVKLFRGQSRYQTNKTQVLIRYPRNEKFKASYRLPTPQALERITGVEKKNTLLPVNFLIKGAEVQNAVCRISLIGDGKAVGTGFLISKDAVMTNNHVIKSFTDAKSVQFEFGQNGEMQGNTNLIFGFCITYSNTVSPINCFRMKKPSDGNESGVFFTSDENDLDFTVVRIDIPTNHTFGFISLKESALAEPLSRCYIIGHPKGRPKEVSLQKNIVLETEVDGKYVHYTTDTQKGSSGSPVFNDKWQVIALHRSAGKTEYDIIKEEFIWHTNEGVLIEFIKNKLPAILYTFHDS